MLCTHANRRVEVPLFIVGIKLVAKNYRIVADKFNLDLSLLTLLVFAVYVGVRSIVFSKLTIHKNNMKCHPAQQWS